MECLAANASKMSAVFGPTPGKSVSLSFASAYGSFRIGESRPWYCESMIRETSMMFGALDLYNPAVRMHSMTSLTLALDSSLEVIRYLFLSFLKAVSLFRSFVFCDRIV
jgi:hypothetical protein